MRAVCKTVFLKRLFRSIPPAILGVALATQGFAQTVHKSPKHDDINVLAHLNSRALFDKLYSDPVIMRAFDLVQMSMLRTSIDYQNFIVLEQNPFLQAAKALLEAELEASIRESQAANKLGMTRLNPEIPAHQKLLSIARASARDAGMSGAKANELEYYVAMGPVNAYTEGKLFVVVYNDLIDAASFEEVIPQVRKIGDREVVEYKLGKRLKKLPFKAVLGHETGHIKAQHVIQGIMNMVMTIQLAKIFAADELLGNGGMGPFFEKLQQRSADLPQREFWISLMDHFLPNGYLAKVGSNKDRFVAAIRNMSQMFDQFSASQTDGAKMILGTYLASMSDIISRSEMPAEVGTFITTLSMLLDSPGALANKKFISAKQFKAEFQALGALISREQETSADFYMYMGVDPLHAITLDLLFGGARFEQTPENWSEYMKEIKRYSEAIRRQAVEAYGATSQDTMNDIVGGTGKDHPTSVPRILNLLDNAQTADIIAMRNPFLRLVVTRNALLQQAQAEAASVALIDKQLDAVKDKVPPQLLKELMRARDEKAKLAQESIPRAEMLTDLIIERVAVLGFDAKTNPRLANLIDYALVRKNQVLREREALKGAGGIDKDQAARLKDYATRGDDILEKIAAQMKALEPVSQNPVVLKERAERIEKTLAKNLNVEKVASLRLENRELPSGRVRAKRTLIQDDARFVNRTSSLADRYAPKAKMAVGDDAGAQPGGSEVKKPALMCPIALEF